MQNIALADLRRKAELSQQQAAEAAGCSISTVRAAEYGVTPSPTMQARLAGAVGATPAAIWPEAA